MKRLLLPILVLTGNTIFCQVSFTPVDTLIYYSSFSTFQIGNSYPIDFNKDGFDDLLFLKGTSIYLRENSGLNTFGEEFLAYTHTSHINSISNFADVNNDTYSDIAISDGEGIYLLYFSNNTFIKEIQSSDVVSSGQLMLFDHNQDNKIDLAYASGSDIYLYHDVATGMTDKSHLYTDPDGMIYNFAIKDLNADDIWDLTTVIYAEILKILFGNADGSFETIFSKPASNMVFFEFGDLNLDGFTDLTYLEWGNNLFTAVYNSANTSYTDNALFSSGSVPGNLNYFKLIDLKHNGTLDLVYNDFFSFAIRENNGSGQFQPKTVLFENPFTPQNFALFNLNNDGYEDLLFSDKNKFQIVEFTSEGNSGLQINDGYYHDFWDVLYQDMDEDGFNDIISISRSGSVIIRWGNADHSFEEYTQYPIPLNAYYGTISDINADGKLDILMTLELNSNKVVALDGLGNREFSQAHDWKFFPFPGKAQIIDINKDGKKYFISHQSVGNEIAWLDVEETNFNEYQINSNKKSITGDAIATMSLADMNNDEYIDLLTANSFSKTVSILTNNKAGNFDETVLVPDGSVAEVTGVNAFDYNNDLHQDLLLIVKKTDPEGYDLQVFFNDQLGNFSYHTTHNLVDMYLPRYINILDINDDQHLDFIVSDWDYQKTNIFINENSQFINKGPLSIENVGQSSRIYKDLNGDTKPDIFTANFITGNTFVQLNNTVIEPSQIETEINIEEVGLKRVKIVFTPTTAAGRLVVITKGTEFTETPDDNNFYAANLQYGLGNALGTNSHVVHVGASSSLEIKGLSTSSHYLVSVFEYNVNNPQVTIINYTSDKITKAFTTLNSPPQISPIEDQMGTNLEKITVPLNIADEDNLISEFTYSFTSSDPAVVPVNNLVVVMSSESPFLEIQPIGEGISLIELTATDTANNSATTSFQYNSIIVGIEGPQRSAFAVFPSPFKDRIEIKHQDRSGTSLVIYNALGNVVGQFDNIPESIDCSAMSDGIYFFRSSDGKCVKAIKY